MAPANMPPQSVQIRQQVLLATNPLKPIQKPGKRYGRRPVRTAAGEKLPAGRRHRVDSGSAAQFDDDLWDVVPDVIEADVLEEFAEEEVPQPTIPVRASPKPAMKEPKSPQARANDPAEEFPALKEEFPDFGATLLRERSISEMSANSFTEVLMMPRSAPTSPAMKAKKEPTLKEFASLILEDLAVKPPKKDSKNLPIVDEAEEEWMVVGAKGKIVPEKVKPKEPEEAAFEAEPYDAEEAKDSRHRKEWRPNGDAHTGRRSWKVDPTERNRAIEAAQLRKQKKNGGAQEEEVEEEEEDSGKKRGRMARNKEKREMMNMADETESQSTEEDENASNPSAGTPTGKHSRAPLTKKQRVIRKQRTLSK